MTRRKRGPALRRATLIAAGALAWASHACRASAQQLRSELRVDLPVTIGGAAALAVSEGLLHAEPPLPCGWCDRNAAGHDTLNPLDRAARSFRWSNPGRSGRMSDVTGFVLTPLIAGGTDAIAAAHDGRASGIGTDLLVVAQTGILAAESRAESLSDDRVGKASAREASGARPRNHCSPAGGV